MIKLCRGKVQKIFLAILCILSFAKFSEATDEKKWILQVDIGKAAFPGSEYDGSYFSFRASKSLKLDNSLMSSIGIMGGSAPNNTTYKIFAAEIKYRFRTNKKISPFIGAGGGILSVGDYAGLIFTGAFGIDINIQQRYIIPIAWSFGIGGYGSGPSIISVGFGCRF